MPAVYITRIAMGVSEPATTSVIGGKEPIAHPVNCKNECPYGYGRAFCFPCMAKIMGMKITSKETGETSEK